MSDDLDELEAIAKAAHGALSEPWRVEEDSTLSLVIDSTERPLRDDEDARVDNIVADALDRPTVAAHIAAFSPDVVLRLIERAQQAEDAVRYLWHAWAEAEGEGQPKGAVFGVPETYGDPDFERLGAPAELQRAVLRIVGL